MTSKIVSEYDQEIPQSQTVDNPVTPRGRATQPSRDTRKTKTTWPSEAKFHVALPGDRRKYGTCMKFDLGHLLLFIIIIPWAGIFSRDCTTNLSPQCSDFSRALKIEKLKAPLLGCEGTWIAYKRLVHYKKGGFELKRVQLFSVYRGECCDMWRVMNSQ